MVKSYLKGAIMVFVFDLDDTICDTDKFSEFYIRRFFQKHNLPYKQIANNVRFAEKKFNWDIETALKWYKTYGDKMMLEFPCKDNAVKIINSLHNNGHKIVIATARATDWHTEPEKITLEWLAKQDIKYDKIYIGRIDKEKICEEVNADIFIDDDLKITQRVAEYFKDKRNKHAFLYTTDYNKNLPLPNEVERILDFNDFAKKLEIYFKKEK